MATGSAKKFVYEIQAEYSGRESLRRLQDDLNRIGRIEAYRAAGDRWQALNEQLRTARENARRLRQEMQANGGGTPIQQRDYDQARRAVADLRAELARQRTALDAARAGLQSVGVAASQAASQYDQLRRAAAASARGMAARNTLGIRGDTDIRAEMAALKKAYRDLATSGTASTDELRRAAENLRNRLRALRTELQGVSKLDMARSNLGIRADSAIRAEMEALKKSYRDLATSGTASTQELQRAAENLRNRLRALRTELQGANRLDLSRQTLGIRSDSAIRAEMEALKKAYRDLATSGTASTDELRRAAENLRNRLRALRQELQGANRLDLSRQTLGIRSDGAIRAEMEALKKAYRDLATSGTASTDELRRAAENLRNRLRALRQEMQSGGGRADRARSLLGIRSDADIQADIARIRRAYETLRQSGTATAAELRRAHQSMSRQIAGLRGESRGLVETASRLQGLRTALAGFAAAFGVSQLAAQARELFAIADRYAALDAKIKLVTRSEEEAARVRERLYSLSQATGTAYADNADAFSKLALSMREAGIDGEETARIIDIVNKTLVINGSSAGMAGAFMLQFSQAMASGVLQGDEFRSMMENNGYFAGRLAKHLQTNIAGLRQMSRQGELTQAVLRDFFKSAGGAEIDRDFEAIPKRVSMAVQAIKNAWEQIVAASDQGSGASARLVESMTGFATYLESNREGIQELLADIMLLITRLAELGLAFGRWVADNGELVAAAAKSAAAIAGIGAAVKTVTGTVAALSATRVALHGLAVSAGSFATSIAAAGLAMKTGFVGALTASAVAVGTLAHTIYTWRQAEEEVRKSQERGAELRARLAEQLARISAATGVTIKSFQELVQAEKEGKIHFDEATSSWVAGAKQRAAASEETAKTVVKVEGEALKALVQEYKKHFDEIIRLQADITGRQKSLAAELRDLGRTGMSDRDAWADQKREAEEYVAAAKRAAEEAKRAMASGDTITGAARWKEAVQYADDAKAAYKALNREVKDGDKTVVSKADALKTAMAGVKEAGELAIDLLKQQQQEAYKVMDDLEKKSGFSGLMQHMDAAMNKWMEGWRAMQGVGEETVQNVSFRIVEQERQIESLESAWLRAWANNRNYTVKVADELQKKLDEATKPRTVKVYVAEVQKRRLGGLVGGEPARFARGGRLPGYGGGDRVSALLEAGEFVIRKEAVRKWGAGFFAALNNLRLPELPELSALLPPMPKAAAATPMGSMVLELKLPGGDTVAATVSGDDAERLARWNRRVSNTRFRK